MDKKINKIIEIVYKQEIKNKVSLGFAEQDKIDLIEYVMEYERLVLKKEEFIKGRRTPYPT
jgi:hypothetical protein